MCGEGEHVLTFTNCLTGDGQPVEGIGYTPSVTNLAAMLQILREKFENIWVMDALVDWHADLFVHFNKFVDWSVLQKSAPGPQEAVAVMTDKPVVHLKVTTFVSMIDNFPARGGAKGPCHITAPRKWVGIGDGRFLDLDWAVAVMRMTHVCALWMSRRLTGNMPSRIQQAADIIIGLQKSLRRPPPAAARVQKRPRSALSGKENNVS